ncbi:MAG TPA: DHA2 family efflux MFS transporter permease subunit [Methylomirabilota bacterium]|jgi:DHA2 family multidrug resistance protein
MDAAVAAGEPPLSSARKWAITFSVMLLAVMQILDTSVTNVVLPHIQGTLSASVEEVSWVVTSYLAANAIVIPATGWLSGLLGRRRFFMTCAVLFTVSSFLSGIAPTLDFLILARIFQGLGGGPMIPISQAIMWETFPLRQRGLAMSVWGVGIMMGPIFGPTLGGWIADNWSWRWIFYVNLPIGLIGFLMAGAFLFDPSYLKKPGRVDALGLVLMVVGFGCLQFALDRGEREEWFDSGLIVGLAVVAVCALVAFIVRELTADEPILDLSVFTDRNFAVSSALIAVIGFGFYASMLLVALYTQTVLGYDAWTSGLVLAPAGIGNLVALLCAGRLLMRVDQRAMLALGLLCNAAALALMSNLTLSVDYWTLAWPRFLQGFGQGFVFVPLTTLALATIRRDRLGNATAAFNVLRNVGGSVGIAVATTLLARRSQYHQSTLTAHVDVWSAATAGRIGDWVAHFTQHGADPFTARGRAVVMLYRDTVTQAQVLAYADQFWLLALMFFAIIALVPFMNRVRVEPVQAKAEAVAVAIE